MLREIAVKNFKLTGEVGVRVRTKPLTVLIGANGTGKSTLLQILQVLKQTVEYASSNAQLAFDDRLIALGSFEDVVHNRDIDRNIEVDFTLDYFNLDSGPHLEPPLPTQGLIRIQLITGYNQAFPRMRVEFGNLSAPHVELDWSPQRQETVSVGAPNRFQAQIRANPDLNNPIIVQSSNTPSEYQADLQRLYQLFQSPAQQLRRFYLVPAVRGFDQRQYDVMKLGQTNIDPNEVDRDQGQAAFIANLVASKPEVADVVAEWLNAVAGPARKSLRNRNLGGRVSSEVSVGGRSINMINEAFGVNQLVAPLMVIGASPAGSVIGVEEPESHLHPRAQVALTNVFIDVATKQGKQLLLPTHSEHILMGFLTSVAEGRLTPDQLGVYEFRREGDEVVARELAINSLGQVEGGLRNFLEVDVQELGDFVRARFAKEPHS